MKENKKILVVSFQSLTQESAGGMARLGYYVSEQIFQKGILKKFIVFSKGKFTTSFPSEPVSNMAKYVLFAINKLNKFLNVPDYKFRLIQEHIFDIMCQKHITTDISILFTTNTHLERTFKKAKKLGIEIIYVPANPEENYINKIILEENITLGITKPDPYTYAPRVDFFNRSIKYVDTVIGTYPTVYSTYKSSEHSYNVLQINGHLKPDFKKYTLEKKNIGQVFTVVYVASTVALKGLQYLLHAWAKLMSKHSDDNLQLRVVGRIDNTLDAYFQENFNELKNVQLLGRVQDVSEELKKSDLCVVPSLTDGGPYVALEAAHFGIPVVLTENCGSAELLSRPPSGCITIPIRDIDAIKKAILWAYHNREEAKQLGINAKSQLDNYNMSDFIVEIAGYLENKHNKLTG